MSASTLCGAIRNMQLVTFYYAGDVFGGLRRVEPHMVAYNREDKLTLSAWYVPGAGESLEGAGWRHYLISEISSLTLLDQYFDGPRPGYQPDGGRSFHNVQCGL